MHLSDFTRALHDLQPHEVLDIHIIIKKETDYENAYHGFSDGWIVAFIVVALSVGFAYANA